MALKRIMFINYGDAITLSITAYENVGVFEMQPSGDDIEKLIETHALPGGSQSTTWDLPLAAGGIYGFGLYAGADYQNRDPKRLTIVAGNDKNPWPTPPPPPPPPFVRTADYKDRYGRFLMGLGIAGKRSQRQNRAAEPSGGPAPGDP